MALDLCTLPHKVRCYVFEDVDKVVLGSLRVYSMADSEIVLPHPFREIKKSLLSDDQYQKFLGIEGPVKDSIESLVLVPIHERDQPYPDTTEPPATEAEAANLGASSFQQTMETGLQPLLRDLSELVALRLEFRETSPLFRKSQLLWILPKEKRWEKLQQVRLTCLTCNEQFLSFLKIHKDILVNVDLVDVELSMTWSALQATTCTMSRLEGFCVKGLIITIYNGEETSDDHRADSPGPGQRGQRVLWVIDEVHTITAVSSFLLGSGQMPGLRCGGHSPVII